MCKLDLYLGSSQFFNVAQKKKAREPGEIHHIYDVEGVRMGHGMVCTSYYTHVLYTAGEA